MGQLGTCQKAASLPPNSCHLNPGCQFPRAWTKEREGINTNPSPLLERQCVGSIFPRLRKVFSKSHKTGEGAEEREKYYWENNWLTLHITRFASLGCEYLTLTLRDKSSNMF